MKKAVILHGTGSDHTANWFPWLKAQLVLGGFEVWVPDLPGAEKPNLKSYTEFLLASGWDFNENILIGHSSGAVAILELLESLENAKVSKAIFVGVFEGDLGWGVLSQLNKDFNFEKINATVGKAIVIQSDNDPYCPLDGAKRIANKLNARFIVMHDMGHFSYELDKRFNKFPEILEIIEGDKA